MKKKTKIIIGVIAAVIIIPVLAVVGFMSYLGITWNGNHEFQEYVFSEGPWGYESTWVSDDGNSYLVCDKTNLDNGTVTAYFRNGEEWAKYEMHGMNRMVYLDIVENGITVESTSGYMKFDGTTFMIKDLEKGLFEKEEYRYTVTSQTPEQTTESTGETEENQVDLPSMCMVNGTLYLDTGRESTLTGRCGTSDGEITSTVAQNQKPTEDNQSNFGTGYSYQRVDENTIELLINEKWYVFQAENAD